MCSLTIECVLLLEVTRYLTKQKTQAQREAANEHFLLTNHHIILLTHHIILHTHHIIITHTSHHLTYTANEHFLLTNRALTTNKSKMSPNATKQMLSDNKTGAERGS
jgi:hypothetical protein